MRRPTTLTRRHLLEGMSASTVAAAAGAAPFLTRLPSAWAQKKAPTRFLLVTFPNGWGFGEFWTLGVPSGSALPEKLAPSTILAGHPTERYLLQPLEPYRDYITIVGGLKGTYAGKVGPHGCAKIFLTGTGVVQYGPGAWDFHAQGPSVDQFIAQRLGEKNPINGIGGTTYAAANQPVSRMTAATIGQRFFNIRPATGPQPQGLSSFKRTLDPVFAYINRERSFIPQEDRELLDRYATELKALEQRRSQPVAATCAPTTSNIPAYAVGEAAARTEAGNKASSIETNLKAELIVQAFACGLTRVASLGPAGGEQGYWNLMDTVPDARPPVGYRYQDDPNAGDPKPFAVGEHGMDHHPNKGYPPHWVRFKMEIDRYYVAWFADYVLKPLKERQDPLDVPGRSLLDNTAILLTRDMAKLDHGQWPLLHIFAGGAGGALERGRYIRFSDQNQWTNRALITSCQLMGLRDVEQFGLPERSAGGALPIVRS